MKKNVVFDRLTLHNTKIIDKKKSIYITLLLICLMLVGCTNFNSVQSLKYLKELNGKTEVIDNATVNGIDSPLKLTFFNDSVKVQSINPVVNEQEKEGKTYYYLPIKKDQLLDHLPKDRKINNCQFDSKDLKKGKKIPQNINDTIKYIKDSKNKEFILLSPEKYKNLEEFEKNAQPNNFDSGGYTIWEVSKKDRTLTLIHVEQASYKENYHPIKISF